MKLYTRGHDLETVEANSVKKLVELGLEGIQLAPQKSMENVPYCKEGLTEEHAKAYGKELRDAGLKTVMVGGYFNPVHSKPEKVQNGIDVFKNYVSLAKYFDCKFVGSETGSYNDEPWIYHPKNRTQEAQDSVVEVFSSLASYAEKENMNIALEGAFGHCAFSVKTLDTIIKRINHDNVYVIFDLCNYVDISNWESTYDILEEGLETFKDRILLFHLKDYYVKDGILTRCPVGKGTLDYQKILSRIASTCPNANLVFEGTLASDLPFAINYIKEIINKL